ncbi:amidase [Cryptococcus wingfieldii CBS 7118]|uniref:amidase n=1 Tax=Cryptococcus wingfieldii CBS 7118 TaxID=1295528 RepID=A0A1E3INS2_9TREE|nr:amidase [Cryptococcus wingfieldii CBS 7118]ODN90188.1 amidase [Cryptococcus wingfieldii CBS 7118]
MVGRNTVQIAKAKQEERERLISEMESLLGLQSEHPEDEERGPQEIVWHLKGRKTGWTVERVMSVYIRAACAAHRKTNCLTEVLFKEALEQAKSHDREYATFGKAHGAFWGLPSSFKDTYNIKGVDSSLGCSPYCFGPILDAEDEGGLVKVFRAGGGIPFCKTNIPQTLLAFECRNPIFGQTSNPGASDRTCGGSSGGEAALVALRGSPIGWGSDIGGSLRIPAHYSGICGLKPVAGRWPQNGNRSSVKGFEGIKGVVGPMGRTVDDLIFSTRSVFNTIHEPSTELPGEQLLPIAWREVELPKKLKVGYWVDDHAIKASPACARAVLESVQALKKAGHEVIAFDPPDVPEALKIFAGLTSSDGYKTLLSNIGSDPMEPSMNLVIKPVKLPGWILLILVWFVAKVTGDQLFADVLSNCRQKSTQEFLQYTHRRNVYIDKFRRAPYLLSSTTRLNGSLPSRNIATILFNVVDSTVGVLPVTRVSKDLDTLPSDWLEGSTGSKLLQERIYLGKPGKTDPAYVPEQMHGLPVGVQVVGKAWEEEKVLKVMKLLEGLVGYETR